VRQFIALRLVKTLVGLSAPFAITVGGSAKAETIMLRVAVVPVLSASILPQADGTESLLCSDTDIVPKRKVLVWVAADIPPVIKLLIEPLRFAICRATAGGHRHAAFSYGHAMWPGT
jgi:hypothetical protein